MPLPLRTLRKKLPALRRLFFVLLFSATALPAFAEKSEWTTHTPDREVMARGETEKADGRTIRTVVFDAANRVQFIEQAEYDKEGAVTGMKRTLPDGSPWPHAYPIYCPSGLGSPEEASQHIAAIEKTIAKIDPKLPILEISVYSKDHVNVRTGVIHSSAVGGGKVYELKKHGAVWKLATFGSWQT
jgi:hypothetical protein